MSKIVLGIDIGTSGCKLIAMNNNGDILSSIVESYPLYTPAPGWTEQNPDDWWEAVLRGLNKIIPSIDAKQISGISFSGQMHGMVALDCNYNVIRPAILWNDQRTVKQCQEITQKAGGLEKLLTYTNNRMLTGFTGGKILWMKQNEPDNYNKTAVIINPKDYIRFKLCGNIATDVSDASGYGLFDVKSIKWAYELIEKIGLRGDIFPSVLQSIDIAGYITKQISSLTGIPEGVPVIAGGGDAVISTTGLGLIGTGRAGITLGTSGVVALSLNGYIDNPNGMLQISCNNSPNTWHAMGVTLAAAGSYEWFKKSLGNMLTDTAKQENISPFDYLNNLAAPTNPGADGLLYLPYLTGERAPINDPNATGLFAGIRSTHTLGHFARAVQEGVAFSLKQVFDLINSSDTGNSTSDEIVIAGGGAKSPLWRQIFADIFNLPVKTVYGSAEGGSFGAAIVAGVGCGIWDSLKNAASIIKPQSTTLPNPLNLPIYSKAYEKYLKLYPALSDFMHLD